MPCFTHPASGGLRTRRVREFNDCNLPRGKEDGGRFGANDDPRCEGGAAPPTEDERDESIRRKAEHSRPHQWLVDKHRTGTPEERASADKRMDRLTPDRAPATQSWQSGQSDVQDIARSEANTRIEQRAEERKQQALQDAIAARRAAGVPEPDLTTQDTKKSDTKKNRYTANDRIIDTSGNTDGTTEGIFGDLTHEEAAEIMTQYIDEDMELTVSGGGSGGGSDQEPGPDPDDAKADYERYQENAMDEASSAHYTERTEEFERVIVETHEQLDKIAEEVLAKHREVNTVTDPNAETLTGEKLAEILTEHNILSRRGVGKGREAFATEFDDDVLESGDLRVTVEADEVYNALFNPDSLSYDNPNVVAARDAILALKPDPEMTASAFTDAIMADSAYASDKFNIDASDWYSETNQSDEIDYDDAGIKDFDTWYEDQYGHDPDDWQDVSDNYNGGGGGDESEVTFDFAGADGSTITRVFSNSYDGVSVYHSYFRNLGPAGQGKGMMRGQMELYEKIGVKEITTTANISTGSYSWARYGFQADSPSSLAYSVTERMSAILQESPELQSVADRVNEVISDYSNDGELPWQVADLRVTGDPAELRAVAERFMFGTRLSSDFSLSSEEAERWDQSLRDDAAKGTLNLGKLLMTGHNWSARFDMTNEDQRSRMRDYIGDWTQPASQQTQGEAITQRVEAQTQRAEQAVTPETPNPWPGPTMDQPRAASVQRTPSANAIKHSGAQMMTGTTALGPLLGNNAKEVTASNQLATTSRPGTRVYRLTTDGQRITGQVSTPIIPGRGRITVDEPDMVSSAPGFTGPWLRDETVKKPTPYAGQVVRDERYARAGSRVRSETPKGKLTGRVQGPYGERAVQLDQPPPKVLKRLRSLPANSGVIQWRKK